MKKALSFSLIMTLIGAVGGYLVGMYTFAYYTEEMRSLILSQVGSRETFYLLTMAQSAVYVLITAFLGYLMSAGLGLMRPIKFEKEPLGKVLIMTLIAGLLFFLDAPLFGRLIPEVAAEYAKGISLPCFPYLWRHLRGSASETLLHDCHCLRGKPHPAKEKGE